MRLFVSLLPAAGPSATLTLVTEQADLRRTYTLLAAPTDLAAPVLQQQAQGLWAYQLGVTQLHTLTTLVAGKHTQEARTILLRMQGIRQINITSSDWWDDLSQQTLPQDPGRIRVVVISWAGV
jgi:hypothetical protein